MSYAGVDIGTNGCKVTIISDCGEIIYHDSHHYHLSIKRDRAELSPQEVWNGFCDLMSRTRESNVVILKNHGCVAVGNTLKEAYFRVVKLDRHP